MVSSIPVSQKHSSILLALQRLRLRAQRRSRKRTALARAVQVLERHHRRINAPELILDTVASEEAYLHGWVYDGLPSLNPSCKSDIYK